MRRPHSFFIAKLIVVLLVVTPVALWQIQSGDTDPLKLRWGTPESIASTLVDWFATGDIWEHILSTVSIAVLGLLIGAVIGIAFGYVLHSVVMLRATLVPIMTWLNSLPRILLVPIFIAGLGIGPPAKLVMVVAMTLFIFFFNVLNGLDSVDERIMENARILGAKRYELFKHVQFPFLVTWIVAGLRPAIGFAFIGAVISEYMGATSGMGYVVDLAYGQDRYDMALAGILVILVLAGFIDTFTRVIESWWFNSGGNKSKGGIV
jgi:NitT/TauT family transport system permease protein